MSTASVPLPNWISYGLMPLLNIMTAFLISGLVVWSIGEDPFAALNLLVQGALGRGDAIGFTLFYTTSFIFTGLAVAVAFHAGLFNIGAEGQAYVGGLGAAIVAMSLDHYVPWYVTMPFAVIGFETPAALLERNPGNHGVGVVRLYKIVGLLLRRAARGRRRCESPTQPCAHYRAP